MDCREARERLAAHLMGEDDAVGAHLSGCADCAREEHALRAVLGRLDRFDRAMSAESVKPRRKSTIAGALGLVAAAAIGFAILWPRFTQTPPAELFAIDGDGSYAVARADLPPFERARDWRFQRGTVVVPEPWLVATLPGHEVRVGKGVRLAGGSRARVTPGEAVFLLSGQADVEGVELRVFDPVPCSVDARGGVARVFAGQGGVLVEVRSGEVATVRGGVRRSVRAPGVLRLGGEAVERGEPAPAEATPDPPAGASALETCEKDLASGDEMRRKAALALAVQLELAVLAPAIRRLAAEDPSAAMRSLALWALWRLAPDREFLADRALRETDPGARGDALHFLGTCADASDGALLVSAIDSPSAAKALLALAAMARRSVATPPEADAAARRIFLDSASSAAAREAAFRFLQDRGLLTDSDLRIVLLDAAQSSLSRRFAANQLLDHDRDAALTELRILFNAADESRRIAIDMLGHYGAPEDLRRIATLLDSASESERTQAWRALVLAANESLDPDLPLNPRDDQLPELRRRLTEWLNR